MASISDLAHFRPLIKTRSTAITRNPIEFTERPIVARREAESVGTACLDSLMVIHQVVFIFVFIAIVPDQTRYSGNNLTSLTTGDKLQQQLNKEQPRCPSPRMVRTVMAKPV